MLSDQIHTKVDQLLADMWQLGTDLLEQAQPLNQNPVGLVCCLAVES